MSAKKFSPYDLGHQNAIAGLPFDAVPRFENDADEEAYEAGFDAGYQLSAHVAATFLERTEAECFPFVFFSNETSSGFADFSADQL